MCLYGNVYSKCVGVHGGQKNSELELQAIMDQPVGVLRTEPKSSASTASTPKFTESRTADSLSSYSEI